MNPVIGIDARLANDEKRAGVGHYCAELLAALPEAAPEFQWRVYLDAAPREGFPKHPSFEVRVLPRRRFWLHRVLGGELRRDPPDAFFSPVTQLPWRCPCPAVVTVHDLAFLEFPQHFPWKKRWSMRFQAGHALRHATGLVADSESARKEVLRRFAIAPDAIDVAPLGCAPRFFAAHRATDFARVRQRYQLPERFVLYVGRIQPRKNLPRLIEAFAGMCARQPDLPQHLVLAGDAGWLETSTRRAAQETACRDRIHFTGHVADEDLPVLMAAADVLALVSLWEGFGLPVIEAMAGGTAVITSNCSSLPEAAGDAALLVDPLDTAAISQALEILCANEAHRKELAARGRAHAAAFTWARTARCTAEALLRALAGNT